MPRDDPHAKLREALAQLVGQNPGLSTKELAARLGRERDVCYGQLMRLKKQGHIRIVPKQNGWGVGTEYRYFPKD